MCGDRREIVGERTTLSVDDFGYIIAKLPSGIRMRIPIQDSGLFAVEFVGETQRIFVQCSRPDPWTAGVESMGRGGGPPASQ